MLSWSLLFNISLGLDILLANGQGIDWLIEWMIIAELSLNRRVRLRVHESWSRWKRRVRNKCRDNECWTWLLQLGENVRRRQVGSNESGSVLLGVQKCGKQVVERGVSSDFSRWRRGFFFGNAIVIILQAGLLVGVCFVIITFLLYSPLGVGETTTFAGVGWGLREVRMSKDLPLDWMCDTPYIIPSHLEPICSVICM